MNLLMKNLLKKLFSFTAIAVLLITLVANFSFKVSPAFATFNNPEVSINEQVSCGSGSKTFSGSANYHGDSSTRLIVTFNPPGSNNTTTEIDSTSEPSTWSFTKNVNAGSTYTIEAKVWDNSYGFGSPDDTDTWTFTVATCPSVDVCTNIEGNQASLPDYHYFASEGICLEQTPVCTDPEALNYDSEVSEAEFASENACEYPVDICPNIDDVQTSLPEGYEFDDEQNCVEIQQEEEPTPTLTPTPTTPSNPGGPGDGLSDGRSDGRSDGLSSGIGGAAVL